LTYAQRRVFLGPIGTFWQTLNKVERGMAERLAHLVGLVASQLFLVAAILLIISSAYTIADNTKAFAVTGLVSGIFIIVCFPLSTLLREAGRHIF